MKLLSVDFLANTYTNGPILKPSIIPFTDYPQELKKYSFLKTNLFMINQGNFKGNNYFKLYYKDSIKTWFSQKNYSRNYIVTVNKECVLYIIHREIAVATRLLVSLHETPQVRVKIATA